MTLPFTLAVKWIVGSTINTSLKDVRVFEGLSEDRGKRGTDDGIMYSSQESNAAVQRELTQSNLQNS